MGNERAKVAVGIPHTYWIAASTTKALMDMFYNTKKASMLTLEMIGGSYHHTARNGLVVEMLDSPEDYTHLLFVDSDIAFPPDALDRLIEHDLDVVGALIVQKAPPFPACSLMFIDDAECKKHSTTHKGYMRSMNEAEMRGKGLLEVASVGYGFTLFKREVFENITYPWFSLPANDDPYGMSSKKNWNLSMVGEDIYFARKAEQHNVKMHLDRDLKCGHFGNIMYTYEMWDQWHSMYAPPQEEIDEIIKDEQKRLESGEACSIGLD